ncbi:MAG: hypothetical protein LHV68_11315 [Elusimicrobia bacterium]|nr:hypothetical protein [Candidatus Liberimonas magnetica]
MKFKPGFYVSIVCAFLLFALRSSYVSTGMAEADILAAVFLIFVISYNANFPFVERKRENLFISLPFVFLNALALFLVPSLLAYLLKFTLGMLFAVYMVFLCLAVLTPAKFLESKNTVNDAKSADKGRKDPKGEMFSLINLFMFAAVLYSVYLGIKYGCWLSGDYTWHGSAIRKLREISPVLFNNFLIKELPYPQYGCNIWHLFLAFISYISAKDTAYVWLYSNFYLTVIKIACFYLLARELFKDSYWGKVSTVIYLIYFSFLGLNITTGETPLLEHRWFWSENAYPSSLARDMLIPMFFYYIFKGINEHRLFKREILVISVLIPFIHFYYLFLLLFVYLAVFLACYFVKTEETELYKKGAITYSFLFIPSIGYTLYYKQLLDSAIVNPIFMSPESIGWSFYTYIYGKYPVLKFWQYFVRNYYFGFSLLCLIPVLFSFKVKKIWKVFLSAPLICLELILFNPFILYLFKKANPPLDRIYRFIELAPIALLVAGVLYIISDETKWISRKVVTLILAGVFICLLPFINKYQKGINYTSSAWEMNIEQTLSYNNVIDKYIKPGTRIFPDTKIAWTWPTMFAHYLFIHPCFHGLPPSFDPNPRNDVWTGFFKDPLNDQYMGSFEKYINDIDSLVLLRDTYEKKAPEIEKYKKYFEPPVFVNEMGLVVIGVKHGQ